MKPMQRSWRTPVVVLVCGTLVMMLAFGIRQTYGLFLIPISDSLGWPRGIFSFAVALQSLIWGWRNRSWEAWPTATAPARWWP